MDMIGMDLTMNNTDDNISSLTRSDGRENETDGVNVPLYIGIYIAILNTVIFLSGITCNLVVIAVVLIYKKMHTTINFYLLNLSVADLCILLVCQPVAMSEYFWRDKWFLGSVACKLIPVLESAVHHASTLTILAITFERTDAICKPLIVFTKKRRRSRILIPLIWISSLVLASPFAEEPTVEQSATYCLAINVLFFVLLILVLCMHIKIIGKLRSSANLRRSSECEDLNLTRSQYSSYSLCSELTNDSPSDFAKRSLKRHRLSHISIIHEEEPALQPDMKYDYNNDDVRNNRNSEEDDTVIVSSKNKEDAIEYQGDNNDDQDERIEMNFEFGSSETVASILPNATAKNDSTLARRKSDETGCRLENKFRSFFRNNSWGTHHSEPNSIPRLDSGRESLSSDISAFFKRRLSTMGRTPTPKSILDHRSQITVLIIIVVFLFISYMPIRIFILWQIFAQVQAAHIGVEKYLNLIWTFRLIMYLHSAANPFIYSFMSAKFMQSFKRLATWSRRKKSRCIYKLAVSAVSVRFRPKYLPVSATGIVNKSPIERRIRINSFENSSRQRGGIEITTLH